MFRPAVEQTLEMFAHTRIEKTGERRFVASLSALILLVTLMTAGRPSVAVVRSMIISGGGTTVNSEYTFTAGPPICVNTGVTYSIRLTIGGVSYGDVGNFVPDCR